MTQDVVNLNEVRAQKSGDSRDWSALDALKALIRDIESGAINPTSLAVIFWNENQDGTTSLLNSCSGLTYESKAAMLALAQSNNLRDWVA